MTDEKNRYFLLEKNYEHRDSTTHELAVAVQQTSSADKLKTVIVKNQKRLFETTGRIFRTMYHIAREDRLFTDHPDLVELQSLTGANMGRMLHGNNVYSD